MSEETARQKISINLDSSAGRKSGAMNGAGKEAIQTEANDDLEKFLNQTAASAMII